MVSEPSQADLAVTDLIEPIDETGNLSQSHTPGVKSMILAMGFWVIAAVGMTAAVALDDMLLVRGVAAGISLLCIGAGVLIAFVGATQYVMGRLLGEMDRVMHESQTRQNELLETINERAALSDHTRAAAFWQSNAVAMQRAARDLMNVGRFEQARKLIDRIAEDFGDTTTAERLREQLAHSRKVHRESLADQAQVEIDTYISQNDWVGAREAANRLAADNAEVEKIAGLPDYVEQKHDKYRRRLIMDYKRAAAKGDIDAALAAYDELEGHSTEEQLEIYQEGITKVRNRKKKVLTEQFKQAVAQQNWGASIEIGQEIIERFPDSRTADEVRAIRGRLKKRAETSQAGSPEESTAI